MRISTFLTEADQERVRPRNTMKKKGPQRSQSLKALPGSSLNGLGKTTSFKLLTILDRSRFTVSQTGSVSVFGGDPNPDAGILPLGPEARGGRGGLGTAEDTGGTSVVLGLVGGGRLDGMKVGGGFGAEEMGMEARGGDGGRAGRTEVEWELMRFSISSISDWDVECKGIVSL